jgi:hypothetical protein
MRILQWIVVGAGMFLAAAPAASQTYDPRYPVCLQVFDRDGGHIACVYTSLAQCAMSASGISAQCLVNPFYRHDRKRPGRVHRGRHRLY